MKTKRELMSNSKDFFFDPFFDGFLTGFRKDYDISNRVMNTDIKEKEDGYDFEIEMPGFNKKDITLNLDKGYLTVQGNSEISRSENCEGYLCRERKLGLFSRSYYIGDVKEEEIKAKLENGILKIFVPKPDKKLLNKKQIMID